MGLRWLFTVLSSRTALGAGKLACRDAQTLDGATGMSTQAYAPECECLSGLRECDARGQSAGYTFEGAADKRHEGLRDKPGKGRPCLKNEILTKEGNVPYIK